MSWEDINRLRKSGQIKEAHDAAIETLKANPDDFKTKSQYEWVIFDFVKRIVNEISDASKNQHQSDIRKIKELMTLMREYYYLKPQIPGMACSNIISQLTKVGKHIPEFPDIIKWVGIDGLRPEDWQPNEYQGKTYSSSALKIARALCKWIMAHPEDCENHLGLAMEWVDRVSETAKGNDALWLNKDKASLLRKMGDYQRSAELLSDVIKAKQNEFWVWAEAGRLYMSEQPDLALSCFCRALECPSDPKFLVGVHLELAELLAEKGEYAQASKEVLITIDIRLAQGWPIGREIESIIANPWYDSSAADAEESKDFYSKHSAAALALCFDAVETKAANYLGTLLPHSSKNHHLGRKPKPLSRFAFKDAEGHAWSLVGPGNKNMKVKVGAPVLIMVGQQNEDLHQTIINVSARPEGEHWDCLEPGIGVVTREPIHDKPMKVFIVGSGEESDSEKVSEDSLRIGDGVRFGLARNPKNNRVFVFNLEKGELPEKDVKLIRGKLHRNPKGFGFVEDAYVAPNIIESVASEIVDVTVLAVYGKHPTKDERSWRVIKLTPT